MRTQDLRNTPIPFQLWTPQGPLDPIPMSMADVEWIMMYMVTNDVGLWEAVTSFITSMLEDLDGCALHTKMERIERDFRSAGGGGLHHEHAHPLLSAVVAKDVPTITSILNKITS